MNRQRALEEVETTWVAFLDDDDYLYGHHIGTLLDLVAGGDVDYAYSWFSGDQGPKPTLRGRQMDPRSPHPTCITVLVRTDLARVAGFTPPRDPGTLLGGEDWQFQLRCLALGARFAGTGEITWHYRRHHGRTGGMAWRTTAI